MFNSNFFSIIRNLGIILLLFFQFGFVLLNSNAAKLGISPESPEIEFLWNGDYPVITDKEEYDSGKYKHFSDEEFMQQLLEDSLKAWNDVYGSYAILTLSRDTVSLDSTDLKNSIVVDKDSNLTFSASALPIQDPENDKVIADCDIKISNNKFQADFLLQTLIHELGHCLGLGHAHSNYNAIMGYSRNTFKSSTELGADDKAGIIFLYPDPTVSQKKYTHLLGCASIGLAGKNMLFLIILLLLPILLTTYINISTLKLNYLQKK